MAGYNTTRILLLCDLLVLVLSFGVGQLFRLPDFNDSFGLWWQAEGQFRIYGLFIVFVGIIFNFGFFYLPRWEDFVCWLFVDIWGNRA